MPFIPYYYYYHKPSNFYAVANGRQNGIYRKSHQAEAQVLGYPGFSMKGFETYEEALAFLKSAGINNPNMLDSETARCDEKSPGQLQNYYGVASGRKNGVYSRLEDAIDQVRFFSGASMMGFETYEAALNFVLDAGSRSRHKPRELPSEPVITKEPSDQSTNVAATSEQNLDDKACSIDTNVPPPDVERALTKLNLNEESEFSSCDENSDARQADTTELEAEEIVEIEAPSCDVSSQI